MTKKAMVTMIRELINGINEVRNEYADYMKNTYSQYTNVDYYTTQVIKKQYASCKSARFFEVENMNDSKLYRTYDNMDMQLLIDALTHVLEGCKRSLEVRQWEINQHLENLEAKKQSEKVESKEEIKEDNNNVETIEVAENEIVYNTCDMNNTVEYKEIIKQIKTLDNYINTLEDKRSQLSNYIRNELNIKCNYHLHYDIKECREYIELNTLMDNKEMELDQLINKRKLIATNNYNNYKDNLITAYGTNKYRIVYNNKIEYSNNIEPFKALECNISIFTLINNQNTFIEVLVYKKEYDNKLYNNSYNKTCKLESIYNYEVNKCLLLDEIIKMDNKIIRQLSNRYDNSNNNIYYLIYWNDKNYIESYVNIKSNFMITSQVTNSLEFDRTYYNLSLLKSVKGIPLEYNEYINKVNDKLNNNTGLKLVG